MRKSRYSCKLHQGHGPYPRPRSISRIYNSSEDSDGDGSTSEPLDTSSTSSSSSIRVRSPQEINRFACYDPKTGNLQMTSEDSNSDSSMDEAENPSPWTGKLYWLEEAKKLLKQDGNRKPGEDGIGQEDRNYIKEWVYHVQEYITFEKIFRTLKKERLQNKPKKQFNSVLLSIRIGLRRHFQQMEIYGKKILAPISANTRLQHEIMLAEINAWMDKGTTRMTIIRRQPTHQTSRITGIRSRLLTCRLHGKPVSHTVKQCRSPLEYKRKIAHRMGICFNCQKEGHFGYNCREDKKRNLFKILSVKK